MPAFEITPSMPGGSQVCNSSAILNGTNHYHNDIVISGISGRLPESSNLDEFRQHLISGYDMVTVDDRRWPPGIVFWNYLFSIVGVTFCVASFLLCVDFD